MFIKIKLKNKNMSEYSVVDMAQDWRTMEASTDAYKFYFNG